VRRAAKQVLKASDLAGRDKPARRVAARLRRAASALAAFEGEVTKGTQRGRISIDDGARWVAWSREARDALAAMRASAPGR
jgi:hypothetical protein